jgi:hypothetical protein
MAFGMRRIALAAVALISLATILIWAPHARCPKPNSITELVAFSSGGQSVHLDAVNKASLTPGTSNMQLEYEATVCDDRAICEPGAVNMRRSTEYFQNQEFKQSSGEAYSDNCVVDWYICQPGWSKTLIDSSKFHLEDCRNPTDDPWPSNNFSALGGVRFTFNGTEIASMHADEISSSSIPWRPVMWKRRGVDAMSNFRSSSSLEDQPFFVSAGKQPLPDEYISTYYLSEYDTIVEAVNMTTCVEPIEIIKEDGTSYWSCQKNKKIGSFRMRYFVQAPLSIKGRGIVPFDPATKHIVQSYEYLRT